eukprot:826182_1
MRKEFYWWAINIYKTFLYHAEPLPRFSMQKVNPMKIYHGINQIFTVDERAPKYFGPVSTTLVDSVAAGFADEAGLLWCIQTTYFNPFNFIVGIDITWISCFKNESEILLNDQYLHITSTTNYSKDNKHKKK